MDNVICDTGKYLIGKIKEYDKLQKRETIKKEKYKTVYEMFGYDLEEKARFDEIYMPIMHKEVPAIKDASTVINRLKQEGHEIYIISYRGRFQYPEYLAVTKQWLTQNNIPYDELITERWDKGKVCIEKNIDLLIDDEPVHLNQAKNHQVNGFIFDSLFNRYNQEFTRVYSWEDVYEKLK